jgi:hypothetical protein
MRKAGLRYTHLMLRSPGWTWQEHELLVSLFAPAQIEQRLCNSIGFEASAAVRCSEAPALLIPRRMHEHMTFDDRYVGDALAWARDVLSGPWEQEPNVEFRDRAITGLWLLNHLGDALVISPDDLAGEAGVSTDEAAAYLEALTSPFGQTGDVFAIAEGVRFARRPQRNYRCRTPGREGRSDHARRNDP